MPHLYQGAEASKEPIVVFSVVDPVVWVFKEFPLDTTQEKQFNLIQFNVCVRIEVLLPI